jgi:hypothetical protein
MDADSVNLRSRTSSSLTISHGGHPSLIGLRENKHHRPREKEILF